jgi:molybdenum cofactor cytidylyltransferase
VHVIGIVLAAGGGSRFLAPHHKLLAELGARSVVEHAVAAASESRIGPLIVVSGAVALPAAIARTPGVQVVHNRHWAEGQATSLHAGVTAAEAAGADAVVVGLGDQPFVLASAWQALAATPAAIAVATYAGLRRNPVRLGREVWPLLPSSGDEGARIVIGLRPDLVQEVPCQGSPADIDTVEDLAQWQNSSSTNSP